jgi:hypothetical protein
MELLMSNTRSTLVRHLPAYVLAPLVLVAGACSPELPDQSALISAPRILAVASEPAEAEPGQMVTYTALWADPTGSTPPATSWSFCNDPVPLNVIEPVSPRCYQKTADWLEPIGNGLQVSGALPDDGCRLFGPNPDQQPGQPAARPVDPDASGGYYQPVRALVTTPGTSVYVTYRSRLKCGISGATQQQAADFARQSRPNANPVVAHLLRTDGNRGEVSPDDGRAALTVKPGETVALSARWDPCRPCGDTCPMDGCGGAEYYVLFDPSQLDLVMRREAMRVSWFASAGQWGSVRTETEADASAPSQSDNHWTAPTTAGDVLLWVVLRDDRGGTGWQSYRVTVAP